MMSPMNLMPTERVQLLQFILNKTLTSLEAVSFTEILGGAIEALGKTEEEIGGDAHIMAFMLTRVGMLDTNTPGVIGGGTTYMPTRLVHDTIWEEPIWVHEEDGEDDE